MPAAITIQLLTDRAGGDVARLLPTASGDNRAREGATVVINEISRVLADAPGRLRVQVDSTAGVGASIALTCTAAQDTAGDVLNIGPYRLVGVASSPDPTAGQWDVSTATDAAYAASVAAAINSGPAQREYVATVATNVVTVTARRAGTWANSVLVVKQLTNATAITFAGSTLTGGLEPGAQTTQTVTVGAVGTAAQTFVIGNVTLTLAATAANENQVTIGGTAQATAVNLAAAIAAHTRLRGIFTCSTPAAGVFTITCLLGGRVGALVSCSTTITSTTLTNSGAFVSNATATRITDGLVFPLGAA
jgi:hypothetical protein